MTTLIPQNYKQVIEAIKKQIQLAQYQSLRLVNQQMIQMYWQIGKLLSEQVTNGWGKSIVENVSIDIRNEHPGIKGFSARNLWFMKQFYEEYADNLKLQQLVAEIAWGQNLLIMTKVKDIYAKEYYLAKCKENGWSRAVLEEEIKFIVYACCFKHKIN